MKLSIRELDQLRYEKPISCLNHCRNILAGNPPKELIPRLLAISGSACRVRGWNRKALKILSEAKKIAIERRDYSALGDIYQRLALVISDRGDFERSLELIGKARTFHHFVMDLPSVGKTLVDEGNMRYYLQQFYRCAAAQRAALEILHPGDHSHIFTAHHTLARAFLEVDRLDSALEHAQEAQQVPIDRMGAHRSRWLEGEILHRVGRSQDAAEILSETMKDLIEEKEGDCFFVALDLLRIQLTFDPLLAYQTARDLCRITILFEEDSIEWPATVIAALDSVVLAGRRGEGLTEGFLQEVAKVVQEARKSARLRA